MTDTLSAKELYKNRELSWLQFEKRVLFEAGDTSNRLLERLKFLSITGSNLDEFFMIRVATLKSMKKSGYSEKDISGMTAEEQLRAVSAATHELMDAQYHVLNDHLKEELEANGIFIVDSFEKLSLSDRDVVSRYYRENVYPVLTPMVIDGSRRFPLLRNNYLYVGGMMKRKGENENVLALVQVPSGIERVYFIRREESVIAIPIECVIRYFFTEMFDGCTFYDINTFRVIRNADFSIEETEGSMEDLLTLVSEKIEKREWGEAIRLEISGSNCNELGMKLMAELDITSEDIYYINGPIDLTFLSRIYELDGFDRLRNAEYVPVMPWEFDKEKSIFEQINEHDLMLIHPFESFEPVIDFINEAANDRNVLAIKQTLYRVGGNSPIVKALAKAAENGKQVTVLVELKARFDEENNIVWARMLESAGCHVIYGFTHLKTHCKISLVVRKEGDSIKRYVHLGTGNYNDSTARLYTDISFFTAKDDFGEDAQNLFNMLSGGVHPNEFRKLSLAPDRLRPKFLELIEREAEHARKGEPSHIVAKVNSLCDKEIIDTLYRASQDGVKIDLIVRGICSLRSNVPGVSENITVRSIVGNFLEHSRIFYFKNGGEPEYFCASADWMPRNMDKRIEILFPVERKRLQEKLNHVLKLMLKDNRKAWILEPSGDYARKPDDKELYAFQEGFCKEESEELMKGKD